MRALVFLLSLAIPAGAVSISNLTTSTLLFHDNFETGGFAPTVGTWSVVGPGVTVTNAAVPGAAEGTFYAQLFRDSNQINQGNLQAVFAEQSTAGDTVLLKMMVYLPDDGVDTRAQLLLDDGDFNTARAWAVPDGAGHVLAVGPAFGRTDTGLTYSPNAWQEWDLLYVIGSSTFSVSVNGATASGFASFTAGSLGRADLFNGARSPAGSFFLDGIPPAATSTPEPSATLLIAGALVLLRGIRSKRPCL